MPVEILVIGSREGQAHAEYLVNSINKKLRDNGLYNSDYNCIGWWEDEVWENGSTTLESLYTKGRFLKRERGFVIAMFSPDDLLTSRGKTYCVGRDNVWLEYGLFSGILGYKNVFAMFPENDSTFKVMTPSGEENGMIGQDHTFHFPSDFGTTWYKSTYYFLTPYNDDDYRWKSRLNEEIAKIYKKIYTRIMARTKVKTAYTASSSNPPSHPGFTDIPKF